MRLREYERTALIVALEEEYASDEEAAGAIFNKVVALLQQRDSYGLRVSAGETILLPYGPYWDKTSAKTAGKGLQWESSIHPLRAPVALAEALKEPELALPTHCKECGHPRLAHGFSHKRGCIVSGCVCGDIMK